MAQVLPAQIQHESHSQFPRSSLRRSPASQPSLVGSTSSWSSTRQPRPGPWKSESVPSSPPSSAPSSPPSYSRDTPYSSSFAPSSASSVTLDTDDEEEEEVESSIYCSSNYIKYDDDYEENPAPKSCSRDPQMNDSFDFHSATTLMRPPPLEPAPRPEDDIALRRDPSRHVDYLSHDWKEEDIWCSWRHIVANRRFYGERSRLENASWRTWAKVKSRLRTVAPETIHWLKDCDVTWLYGPLQTTFTRSLTERLQTPTGNLSKTNSFLKKPILKKRSMSEIMLQKSISTSSLVKQAAAALEAQRNTNDSSRRKRRSPVSSSFDLVAVEESSELSSITSATSDLHTTPSSSPQSPTAEKRHIRWDNKVEQCIAVELKDVYEDEEPEMSDSQTDASSGDEGVVMMKATKRKANISRTSSRGSFSSESRIIAKLPSTTLKDRQPLPNLINTLSADNSFWNSKKILSPSPSEETLRPSQPSQKFTLDDYDADEDVNWDPPKFLTDGAGEFSKPEGPMFQDAEDDDSEGHDGLRRTASGMLMPYDPEDDSIAPSGLLGRVVDTVNTARDIAHVIWNVGWKRT